jgi:Arc/MetJ family transcription regulator
MTAGSLRLNQDAAINGIRKFLPRTRLCSWPVRSCALLKRGAANVSNLPRAYLLMDSQVEMCDYMCGGSHMATNLNVDARLIDKALQVSGEKTKKAAVTKALQEFIARREQRRILELFATLEWNPAYDYKKERSR